MNHTALNPRSEHYCTAASTLQLTAKIQSFKVLPAQVLCVGTFLPVPFSSLWFRGRSCSASCVLLGFKTKSLGLRFRLGGTSLSRLAYVTPSCPGVCARSLGLSRWNLTQVCRAMRPTFKASFLPSAREPRPLRPQMLRACRCPGARAESKRCLQPWESPVRVGLHLHMRMCLLT